MAERVPAQTQPAGGLAVEGLPAWQLARRERIVKAAFAALEQQEYEQIQIRDVAAAADVALGTLYRYFSSKEHLYAAVLQEWAAQMGARPVRTSKLPPSERVRRRVHSLIRAFAKQPQFFKVHVLLAASADPNAREFMASFTLVSKDFLASEFSMLPEEEAQDAGIMLWSIVNSMVTQTIYQGGQVTEVHRVVDRFLDLMAPQMAEAAQA